MRKPAALMFVMMLATVPAHAATLDIASSNITYWPIGMTPDAILGETFLVPDTSVIFVTRGDLTTVQVGDFATNTVLLDMVPVGDYLCPAGEACHIHQFGLAVYLTRSVGIAPGTGSLNLEPVSVDEPATVVLMTVVDESPGATRPTPSGPNSTPPSSASAPWRPSWRPDGSPTARCQSRR